MKQVKKNSGEKDERGSKECLPPLIKADEAIMIHINLVEKACHSAFGHGQSSLLEGST